MATDRSRPGLGDPSLSPDLIAQRGFLTVRRGFDPDEVKAFLASVADELRTMRQREAALDRARRDAEERAAHPSIDENTLMAAVGEETASILRSAHAAANDIRAKAEDNAARILKEAHDRTAAMLDEAETVLAKRTSEAEAVAARITEAAAGEAERIREIARQEGDAVRAQAEAERRLTIEAAHGARERILNDLTRRRNVAVVQIEQLRAGRERLLEAYKVVRGTLDEVTSELQRADAEARAAADAAGRKLPPQLDELELADAAPVGAVRVDRPPATGSAAGSASTEEAGGLEAPAAPPAGPADIPPGDSGGALAHAGTGQGGARGPGDRVVEPRRLVSLRTLRRQKEAKEGVERPAEAPRPGSPEVVPAGAAPGPGVSPAGAAPVGPAAGSAPPAADAEDHPNGEGGPAQVGDLFARIRADREQAAAEARAALADHSAGTEADTDKTAKQSGTAGDSDARVSDEDEDLLQRRDQAIDPIEASLARKLKRVLQDEQNDLLDRLRGLRTRPTAAAVLPAADAHAMRFAEAGRPLLDKAAQAGAAFASSLIDQPPAPPAEMPGLDDLAAELARAIVDPLRRRLEQVFDENHDDDPAVLVDLVGAAYREWKTQRIEQTAADQVANAFGHGAFAATPDGTARRWLVHDVDGPCPDCDDNALAGALPKGEPFPTGQPYPPAHAGCRCLLVPPPA